MVVGSIVGAVSTLSYVFISPILEKRGIVDVAGLSSLLFGFI